MKIMDQLTVERRNERRNERALSYTYRYFSTPLSCIDSQMVDMRTNDQEKEGDNGGGFDVEKLIGDSLASTIVQSRFQPRTEK